MCQQKKQINILPELCVRSSSWLGSQELSSLHGCHTRDFVVPVNLLGSRISATLNDVVWTFGSSGDSALWGEGVWRDPPGLGVGVGVSDSLPCFGIFSLSSISVSGNVSEWSSSDTGLSGPRVSASLLTKVSILCWYNCCKRRTEYSLSRSYVSPWGQGTSVWFCIHSNWTKTQNKICHQWPTFGN